MPRQGSLRVLAFLAALLKMKTEKSSNNLSKEIMTLGKQGQSTDEKKITEDKCAITPGTRTVNPSCCSR